MPRRLAQSQRWYHGSQAAERRTRKGVVALGTGTPRALPTPRRCPRGTNLGGAGVRVVVQRATTIAEDDESRIDVDGSDTKPGVDLQASLASLTNSEMAKAVYELYPAAFTLAANFAFTMLSYVLKRPTRKASPFARSTINPYVTIILTFLATLIKQNTTLSVLEKLIPWEELAAFFTTVPSAVPHSQGLTTRSKKPERCLRVFERGYWKSGEKSKEVEVLDASESEGVTDGTIADEDDEDDNAPSHGGSGTEIAKRWTRIIRCAVGMARTVGGLTWVEGTKEWRVESVLSAKVQMRKEEKLE
ncbi:hypothetical protein HWV62_28007 [Athelia sp. TMB]|nr:hypothetical protein HWV62_28007 [Athelia sp. TMB]